MITCTMVVLVDEQVSFPSLMQHMKTTVLRYLCREILKTKLIIFLARFSDVDPLTIASFQCYIDKDTCCVTITVLLLGHIACGPCRYCTSHNGCKRDEENKKLH